jgi:predicted DsbA family dithiol-disulfide isomerase
MDAYWSEGQNIGDAETLRGLAAEAGLDGADKVFDGDAYEERVLVSTAQAQHLGIHAIPAFVVDSKLLILGAQPREVFEQAFERLNGG